MMNRCTKCVIPDSRPDTQFVDGVCSACIAYANRPNVDWDERLEELKRLLDRHNGEVIVPSSGGKDSTYQALTLKDMGAHVTAVTATTCYLTDIGRHNIDNLASYVDTIEVTPDRSVRAKLNHIGLTFVGDISWPEHVSIFTTPMKVARDTRHTLLMYGENPQNQYGGPPGSEEAKQMTQRWVAEFGGFLGLRPSDVVGVLGLTERDLEPYAPIAEDTGMEAHFLGQYIPWDSHQNAAMAENAGFMSQRPSVANWWDFENVDNAMTGLHDFGMFVKYGYGRGAAQISVDIRSGLVTREEALQWVESHDGMFPFQYAKVPVGRVLNRIGMSQEDLMKVFDQFTSWPLFDGKVNGRPIFKS